MDHTPLTVDIIIEEEFIQDKQRTVIKNSEEEEEKFINDLKEAIGNIIGNIDMSDISNIELLEKVIQEYTSLLDSFWNKYSKLVRITKHSKVWWTKEYSAKLNAYHTSKFMVDWKEFKEIIKKMK